MNEAEPHFAVSDICGAQQARKPVQSSFASPTYLVEGSACRLPDRGSLSSEEIEAYSLSPDDLLVVRVNGSRSIVGRFITVPASSEILCFNDHLIRVRLDRRMFDPAYVAIIARGRSARDYIEGAAITTAGQLTINQTMLAAMPVPILAPDAQLCFVEKIHRLKSSLDAIGKLQTATAAELDAMLPAILDKAFRGKLAL
jgi:type I restriction enzyme S subunit